MTLSAIAILGTITIIKISDSRKQVTGVKLSGDVEVINRAITAYLASSGDFGTASEPGEILAKLKSRSNDESARRMPGFSGHFLDGRVTPVFQTDEEARSDDERVYWNKATKRFILSTSGPAGIKRFDLADDESDAAGDEQRTAALSYGTRDGWIWDYTESPLPQTLGPSQFATTADPPDSSSAILSSAVSPFPLAGPVKRSRLEPPAISPGSNVFPAADYPVAIALADPNPETLSRIWYSIDYGPWMPFSGTSLDLPIGAAYLRAQAVPTDPDLWESSDIAPATYAVSPSKLAPPGILLSSNTFLKGTTEQIVAALENPNDPAVSRVRYRISSEGWVEYVSEFPTTLSNYPLGYRIEGVAEATSPYWISSDISNESVLGMGLAEVAGFSASVAVDVADSAGVPVAGSFITIRDGDWNDPNTWEGGRIPTSDLSGQNIVVRSRVTYSGATLMVGSGKLVVEGVLLVDNQNINIGHPEGRVEIAGGLVIIDNANFEIEGGQANFKGGGVQICNGNYVNKESSLGTSGIGYIYANNGGIDRVGSSQFSSNIAWATPSGAGTNLPTPENPVAATPPGGCLDEGHYKTENDSRRSATFTFSFSNSSTIPLKVTFFSALPPEMFWDLSFTPGISAGLTHSGVSYGNGDHEASISTLTLPPGLSTLTLLALSEETAGEYPVNSGITTSEPVPATVAVEVKVSLTLP